MACYHPLYAFDLGVKTESGKKSLYISSTDTPEISIDSLPSGVTFNLSNCPHFYKDGHIFLCDPLLIPCGQCIGCRLSYSRTWALRCMCEKLYSVNSYFLTCTYNDDNLVFGSSDNATLCKRDFQLFVKRLRKSLFGSSKGNLRLYYAGEYGTTTFRPHYHAIFFNLPLNDLKLAGYSHNVPIYKSDFLSNVWGLGYVWIGDVTFKSCAYVARYVTKKHKGKDSSFYSDLGIEPEFCCMSRNPGIGFQFLADHFGKIYENDVIFLSDGEGSPLKLRPPQYYDRIYDIFDPERLSEVKEIRRSLASQATFNELSKSKLSFRDHLERKEEILLSRISALKRSKI